MFEIVLLAKCNNAGAVVDAQNDNYSDVFVLMLRKAAKLKALHSTYCTCGHAAAGHARSLRALYVFAF